ncbi:hypothetical protein AMECASPLE_000148 [Ameca splendens]|uniref:Uncharacterized protein n=1 Tax=Ameca splendens TaxID=208324 RepID=A0ABV0XLM9_9TELE
MCTVASPYLHPAQIPLRFSPTQRRFAVGRPTSAAGPAPENSNVMSGGTLKPASLCSQVPKHVQTHNPTAAHTGTRTHAQKHLQQSQKQISSYTPGHMLLNFLTALLT